MDPDRPVDPYQVPASDDLRNEIMAMWEASKRESAERNRRQRDLVLKHPDLADRLVGKLVGYSKPENWNGWIPPSRDSNGALNNSPRRRVLVDIVTEAERRELEL